MMDKFRLAYEALNPAQREAVHCIEGPLLVIAGPGTGKTQLLSVRVANILKKTDALARNILCLTFTENGAENMRSRLAMLIGEAAYDVQINTYHSFGSDLIRRYADYFPEENIQNPVDDLTRRAIIEKIVEKMRFGNPLRQTRYHLEDLLSTISDIKRNGLSAGGIRTIANNNLEFIQSANIGVAKLTAGFKRMPAIKDSITLFENILAVISVYRPDSKAAEYDSLAAIAYESLASSLDSSRHSGKTTALTEWKNNWLVKDADNRLILDGKLENTRIAALADALNAYDEELRLCGLYDFDDMINHAVRVLKDNPELRYTIQEQYLYILLDEYQDTNIAQARLVNLLTDNPVNEGRPNVMAVGDDDQAIYAFQGAQHSNMLDFVRSYKNVRIVCLSENYRSHPDVLLTAKNIAGQIQDRAFEQIEGANKNLTAAIASRFSSSVIERREFLSDIAQSHWIAAKIRSLLDNGTSPNEIAVLSPRHKQIEPMVAYLNELGILSHYEKREDILENRPIKELLAMSRLVLAISNREDERADALWVEVLSMPFWHLPISRIWEIAWAVSDARREGRQLSWNKLLLADGKELRIPALLFTALAARVNIETCESMLDYLIGSAAVDTNEGDLPHVYSPYRDFYTNTEARAANPEQFYQIISDLTVLRKHLRERQNNEDNTCSLSDFVELADAYQSAGERMLNTSPYFQTDNAVQVMTVFKAKGLEFSHVFLLNCQDEVWGPSTLSQANRITLPPNLTRVRHAGAAEDERLRLLYVAVTRVKYALYLTSSSRSFTGKNSKRLKFFREVADENGQLRDYVLPEQFQTVLQDDSLPPPVRAYELDWRQTHLEALAKPTLRPLLRQRLAKYRVSPTHLGTFLDLEYGGPERFFFNAILRFPEAPSFDSEFGNAIHETLEWYQRELNKRQAYPSEDEAVAIFVQSIKKKRLTETRIELEVERGLTALHTYLSARSSTFRAGDIPEVGFGFENVRVKDIPLTGKIDRLEIDHERREITVVDYKTGQSYSRWANNPKLHKYRRQLLCYKLLVEHSRSFNKYKVVGGRLEFIEPDENGKIGSLVTTFDDEEIRRTISLLQSFWEHVQSLTFPKVASYSPNLNGILSFEDDLISGAI